MNRCLRDKKKELQNHRVANKWSPLKRVLAPAEKEDISGKGNIQCRVMGTSEKCEQMIGCVKKE
jgi:hypothetical protein